ncbi:S-protein homolog 5-like [Cynara cardunculus var. scolymus]|nr:S-protein homolog 5-like [Cynara cardunculus var. scolymus]
MEKPCSFSFIFFTTFLCIIISVAESCTFTQGYSVIVINDNINEKVQVHCKSKDNDIGLKSIGLKESVAWSFCDNINFPSTLFYCNFQLGKKHQVFDVYNRDVGRSCKKGPKGDRRLCRWYIRHDGFYMIGMEGSQDVKKYDWKVGQARSNSTYKGSKRREP